MWRSVHAQKITILLFFRTISQRLSMILKVYLMVCTIFIWMKTYSRIQITLIHWYDVQLQFSNVLWLWKSDCVQFLVTNVFFLFFQDLYTDHLKEIIARHPKEKPMFLYYSLQTVHTPLEVPKVLNTWFVANVTINSCCLYICSPMKKCIHWAFWIPTEEPI